MRRLLVAVVLTPMWTRLAAASDSAILQLQIIEGSGLVQTAGSKASRPLTVQVTDETGQPVAGAAVSFRMPDQEVSGAFKSGMKSDVVTTGRDGMASAWGIHWGRFPGEVRIRVLAAKGQARAGTVIALQLQESGGKGGSRVPAGLVPRPSARWRWILVSAGAAGAGVAVMGLARGGSAAAPASAGTVSTVAVRIGSPRITVGP